jgi:hypothetical protein
VRSLAFIAAAFLAGCAQESARPGAAAQDQDLRTVEQVVALNREAESFFANGKQDDAADRIQKAQPLVSRLLAAQQPSLAAVEAASDLDDLYGRMLFANRHYAWARLMFQKNLARWKNWTPQTPETARRLKQAESALAECDRHM